jgi:hypothetical protein
MKKISKKKVAAAASKPAKNSSDFKLSIQSKTLELGDMSFNEPNIIISIVGNETDIRSGIIKAMIADEMFETLIIEAASYFSSQKPF